MKTEKLCSELNYQLGVMDRWCRDMGRVYDKIDFMNACLPQSCIGTRSAPGETVVTVCGDRWISLPNWDCEALDLARLRLDCSADLLWFLYRHR